MRCKGRYFDGQSGQRLDVDVEIDANGASLRIDHPDLPRRRHHWTFSELRALQQEARRDHLTLALRAEASNDSALIDTARLTVRDPEAMALLQELCPNLNKRDVTGGTAWKVTSRAGIAAGALVLMIFVILPAMAQTLAPLIPIEREVAWGKAVVRQMQWVFSDERDVDLVCRDPKGLAALDAMLRRLTDTTDVAYDLNVQIFDHGMVNAFAAPGGQIVIMRGLIEEAQSAEEVAAVLGHEIGHVEARDVTRNALRAAGSAGLLSMVLGDFAGGTLVVLVANATIDASYTREAESAADAYAHTMLDRAGVSLEGMADFFEVLSGLESEAGLTLPEYLSSHPDTQRRADTARAFSEGQAGGTPVLSAAQWEDLQGICD